MIRRAFLAALLLLLCLPSAAWARKGNLLLIGGGERPESVMRRFVELAGGTGALILIVPTASGEPDAGPAYVQELEALGCTEVRVLDLRTREEAAGGEWEALVGRAGGIFFTGGDQRRITEALGGTPFEEAVRAALERGAAVGGTSAGTACMSALMLTGEGDPATIRSGSMELIRGLGLFPGVLLDQHFVANKRLARLLSAVLAHPELLGVGVDESTAIWLRPDDVVEVLGERSVLLVDARRARVRKDDGGRFGAQDVRVDILLPGDTFRVR